ncbi:hypothetical protein ACFPIJ_27660 [Dactylosporangium cerinum]|uniref:CBM6 domain-containing protein n=1 Tax=Dactylosporangium cerinum TaxID=1434730 RepID=A0ABV9W227_9ACTN
MTGDDSDTSRLRTGPWLPEPIVRRSPGTPEVQAGGAEPAPAPPPGVAVGDAGAAPTDPPGLIDHDRQATSVRRRLPWFLAALVALGVIVVTSLATCSSAPDAGRARNAEGDVVPAVAPPTAASSAGPSQSQSAAPKSSPSLSHSATRRAFQPIELEAEAASVELAGSAEAIAYAGASGGRIVRNLGRWGPGSKKTGSLTFSDVTVPEGGTYTMTLYVVHDDGDTSRTAVISVAGGGSVTVATAAGSACCTRTAVVITLKKGRNAVTVGNPDGQAPSIDRIAISAS